MVKTSPPWRFRDRRILAAGNTLWDVASWTVLRSLSGKSQAGTSAAFSPDGRMLASPGGLDVNLWDVASGNPVPALSGLSSLAYSVAFLPDGSESGRGKRGRHGRALGCAGQARAAHPERTFR